MPLTVIPNGLEHTATDNWAAKARADELVRTGGTQLIHWPLTDELWPAREPTPVWAVWVQGRAIPGLFWDRRSALQALMAALAEHR